MVNRDVLLEAFGYFASIVVAVSLMMRSIVRLRWVNLIGAVCFTVYGILISAFPVAALNFAISLINVYFLWKIHRAREAFSVIEMPTHSAYVREFLEFHDQEIQGFQPGFAPDSDPRHRALIVLRDLVPAGMVILAPDGAGAAWVALDFVTPAYRDFKVGEYLFHRRQDVFRALGISRLESAAGNPSHARYLERMGFTSDGDRYRLAVGDAPST